MSEALSYGERALAWIVRQHFRIPPSVFWVMALGGAAIAPFLSLTPALVSVVIALVGVFGVLRWRWHRRRTGLVVVAQPVTVDPADRLAVRAQELVMEGLADRLSPQEAELVHAIPARVGPTDVGLADAIRRRLGAGMIVVGRVDRRADGGWSLFSGVVQAPETSVTHIDWHTRERIPSRAQWSVWYDRLTPTRDVQDVQDPLLMSGEIEAIVRSFAGYIASWVEDLDRAETELRAAIDASHDSDSAVIDALRCELAHVLVRKDRHQEALDLLRRRAQGNAPSAHLLRTLARFLGPQPGDFKAQYVSENDDSCEREEALEALRAAAKIRSDPQRAMTLYNLSAFQRRHDDDEREQDDALVEAMRTSRYYANAWYTRRSRGAIHWQAAERARAVGNTEKAAEEFKESARWYSAALRALPHFRLWLRDGLVLHRIARFAASPVLHANAEDAHRQAGHWLRATWHRFRAERARRRRRRRGYKFLNREAWEAAYANFDFAIIGRDDYLEAEAEVLRAVCLQQMGEAEAASAAFDNADARFPSVALIIRWAVQQQHGNQLPHGIPGGGPIEEDAVAEELRRRGYGAED